MSFGSWFLIGLNLALNLNKYAHDNQLCDFLVLLKSIYFLIITCVLESVLFGIFSELFLSISIVYFIKDFPELAVTGTTIHSSVQLHAPTKITHSLSWHQGWSALAGKQPMSNKIAKYV